MFVQKTYYNKEEVNIIHLVKIKTMCLIKDVFTRVCSNNYYNLIFQIIVSIFHKNLILP